MSSLNIDITGDFNKKLDKIKSDVSAIVADELNAFGIETVAMAKTLAPVDEGFLGNSIKFEKKGLSVEIIVAANYAAYLEFGTRAFAAAYVSSLPAEWQEFAAQFKGGGGSFEDFFMNIIEWVKRKWIEPAAAYPIAKKILRFGIRARPFLYPAIEVNKKILIDNLKAVLK
jgi:HK97 gp10 family phage protein